MAGWLRTGGPWARAGRRAGIVCGLAAATVIIAARTIPASGHDSYRDQVRESAEQVAGAIASARLAAELRLSGKTAFALSQVVVADAELDASDARDVLASREPADQRSLALRDRARQPIDEAVTALRDLSIAVRRDDGAAMGRSLAALAVPARQLHEMQRAG